MSNILLISHTTISQELSQKVLRHTSINGFLNVALMHKVNGHFEVKYTDSIVTEPDTTKVKTLSIAGDNFFPDKLKNSKGYPIHIPVYNQPPFVSIKSGNVANKMTKFVEILEQKMNAIASYHIVKGQSEIKRYAQQRKANLALNKIRMPLDAPKLLTYEENGYCALVPKPPKTSVTELIFIKPFNRLVWMILGCLLLACLIIWRLFLNRGTSDSFWLLLFGMFAMFVGQGVEFRRTHRVVLIILLQLIVSIIFVLSSAYQGAITSFKIQPEYEHRINTVKELIESDMRILVSDRFAEIVKDSKEFQAVKSRVDIIIPKTITFDELNNALNTSVKEKSAIILQCDCVRIFLDRYISAMTNYYVLPQKIITTYGHLAVGNQNPFLQKFQHLMDLSFEAGLPQAWDLFFERKNEKSLENGHQLSNLSLKDLSQIFYFMIIGHACAAFVFLIEVFYCDFIEKLDLSFYNLKLRNCINEFSKLKVKTQIVSKPNRNKSKMCCKKSKVEKPKVRKIFVEPINSVV
ncbi:hypothetical protein ACKWTF_015083 [Chironomus riparius]